MILLCRTTNTVCCGVSRGFDWSRTCVGRIKNSSSKQNRRAKVATIWKKKKKGRNGIFPIGQPVRTGLTNSQAALVNRIWPRNNLVWISQSAVWPRTSAIGRTGVITRTSATIQSPATNYLERQSTKKKRRSPFTRFEASKINELSD